jgi:hypothetical protein
MVAGKRRVINTEGELLSGAAALFSSGRQQQSLPLQQVVGTTAHLYPAMLAMELRESKVWARLMVRGMQSMPVQDRAATLSVAERQAIKQHSSAHR